MKHGFLSTVTLVALLAASLSRAAYPQSGNEQKGFTEVETIQGTFNSDSRLMKFDSTLGWDFNKHFGIFGGVPFYFTSTPASTTVTGGTTTTTPASSHNGMGNAYVGMAFRASNSAIDYAGTITAFAPTGNTADGLSTGRAAVDFTNRFEHSFHKLTPFVEAGASNTVPDSTFTTRPFTSLGAIAHLEEGADYQVLKRVDAGASGYQIVPFGNQKIFSRVNGGKGKNPFDGAAEASGTGLTRENGVNAWVGFEPSRFWRVEVAFTRSTTFDLNSLAFNLRFNVGKMLRSRKS